MREEQQEKHALECAQHIIKISRVHADEYRDSWFGGESNLAKDYMRLRNEVKSLREALAAAQRVVEAANKWAAAYELADECGGSSEEACASSECQCWDGYSHCFDLLYKAVRAAVAAETQTTPHAGGTDA